jgi:hypothetical protein
LVTWSGGKTGGACDVLRDNPSTLFIVSSYSWNVFWRWCFVAVWSAAPSSGGAIWGWLIVVKGLINPIVPFFLLQQANIINPNIELHTKVKFLNSVWI